MDYLDQDLANYSASVNSCPPLILFYFKFNFIYFFYTAGSY